MNCYLVLGLWHNRQRNFKKTGGTAQEKTGGATKEKTGGKKRLKKRLKVFLVATVPNWQFSIVLVAPFSDVASIAMIINLRLSLCFLLSCANFESQSFCRAAVFVRRGLRPGDHSREKTMFFFQPNLISSKEFYGVSSEVSNKNVSFTTWIWKKNYQQNFCKVKKTGLNRLLFRLKLSTKRGYKKKSDFLP